MKRIPLMMSALAIWLWSAAAFAQTMTITGDAVDNAGHPLAGVRVFTMPPTQVSCTRADGTYAMGGIRFSGAETVRMYFFRKGMEIARADVIHDDREDSHRRVQVVMKPAQGAWANLDLGVCKASKRIMDPFETWISGQIVNEETGLPVAGARVETAPASRVVFTDALGFYAMLVSNPPTNSVLYNVIATRAGYSRAAAQTMLYRAENRTIEMLMRSNPKAK